MSVREYRNFRDIEEEYFRNHPNEIDAYLTEVFEDFSEDNNVQALLASLRIIARVKGVSMLAERTGISRQGIQKALSEKGNPKFESINAIMNAMGYTLKPQRLNESVEHAS